MALSRSFYVKLAGACFVVGACMELFMIKTGFYRIVTEVEAANWESHKEERQQQVEQLRQQLLEQYKRRGQAPPEALTNNDV